MGKSSYAHIDTPRRSRLRCSPHASSPPTSSHGSDLVERLVKHVVQHEGEPLCRTQRVKYDLESEADGVGQEHFVVWVEPGLETKGASEDRALQLRRGAHYRTLLKDEALDGIGEPFFFIRQGQEP